MEIKATLQKPYTDQERCDFIVKNNHQQGYEIQETGEALLAIQPDPYIPTDEEQRQARANAYAVEVDPITAHIQRLKDQDPIPEGKIAELIAEREAKVQEIKERFPYSEE
jgi:hypothetical protein